MPFDTIRMGASAAGAYEIEKSLRLNSSDNAYLNRTPSSTTSRTTWTLSFWVKRSKLGSTMGLFGTSGSDNNTYTEIFFASGGNLAWGAYNKEYWRTLHLFNDLSAWYHIVVTCDTTNGTQADRQPVYVNGERITQFSTQNLTGDSTEFGVNRNVEHKLGERGGGSDNFEGYLAEVHFIDGTALTHTSFGETNEDTGQWVPKKYAGSYGTNGFYLKFKDNSNTTAGTLGADTSGNGNNWTPNNFSVAAGAGNDSLEDTPTNNYPTFNPIFVEPNLPNSRTISNGALAVSGATNNSGDAIHAASMPFPLSGKWYVEVNVTTLGTAGGNEGGPLIGITNVPGSDIINTTSKMIRADGKVATTGNAGGAGNSQFSTTFAENIAQGDVWQLAYDADNRYVYFGKSNSWADGSGNYDETTFGNAQAHATQPTANTPQLFILTTPYSSATAVSYQFDINFGQRAFAHTPPTGYKALCTSNIPEPTIVKGTDYFDIITYTGNNYDGTRAITGLNFNPDLVWSKSRSQASAGILFDSVRGFGADKELRLSNTQVEGAEDTSTYGYMTALDNGFNLVTGSSGAGSNGNAAMNVNSQTYATWCWKESATAGFDIVSYTGNGSNRTISHSLGVKPSMMIVRHRGADGNHWVVWHDDTNTGDNFYYLDGTNTEGTHSPIWNGTEPTSSVFSVGTDNQTNQNSINFIAYLFADVEGYCKAHSYTGNGGADGPFIYTGFKPRWVMITGTWGGNWNIFDVKRPGYNTTNDRLFSNLDNAEIDGSSSNNQIDILSNGFKVKGSDDDCNKSGYTFLYLAFAESPFKYSNAR